MWVFDLRYRSVFEPDFVDPLENEGEVLRASRTRTSVGLYILFLILRAGVWQGYGGIRYWFNIFCRCLRGSGTHVW